MVKCRLREGTSSNLKDIQLMKFPKFALALGIAVLTTWPLAAQRWAKLEGGQGYTSGSETILASTQPQPPERIVNTARSFEGLPYVWAGTSPTEGFDCSGFVHEVMRLNGYSVPRMADHQFEKSDRVSREELRPGDMVFFETYLPGPSHVGFYLGEDQFIHASSSGRGVIVSNMNSSYYSTRFIGGGRPPGWIEAEAAAMAPPVEPERIRTVAARAGRPPASRVYKPGTFADAPRPQLVQLPGETVENDQPAPMPTAIP